jgi:hypothetical protein
MERLDAGTERFLEAVHAHRRDHELLQVDVVGGMCAAVDDVHQRDRHERGVRSAEVAVQRQAGVHGRGAGGGHGDGEQCVGTEVRLVLRAVQLDERRVDGGLIEPVHADDGLGDVLVDVSDRLRDALAQVA